MGRTSTTFFECDICALRRIDGAVVPEGWKEGTDFGLVCDDCNRALHELAGRRANVNATVPIEVAGEKRRQGVKICSWISKALDGSLSPCRMAAWNDTSFCFAHRSVTDEQ